MEAGTLKELNLKPGDVVEYVSGTLSNNIPCGTHLTIGEDGRASSEKWHVFDPRFDVEYGRKFRLISRASDTPKTWGEMTDAEKGALLLAAHEGKVIEWDHRSGFTSWSPCDEDCLWDDEFYYRVRPEPVWETVTLFTGPPKGPFGWTADNSRGSRTHRITFTLTDGTPDCTKCPTCGTAKHVDMEEL